MVTKMRNHKLFKRILCAASVALATAGVMGYAADVSAAKIDKTRGRVNVDLEDFTLVESTITNTNDFGLVSQDNTNSRYMLHYKNSFTDRNNLGCTYRSKSKFDLTDVNKIEFYAYALQDKEDNKFMLYVNPSSSKYYHRKDRDEITTGLINSDGKQNGAVWKQSSLCYSSYGSTPQDHQANISARYSNEYVFVGISHQWFVHDAQIFLDNKTVTSTTSGCINLKLKKHNITFIEPKQPEKVYADGSKKEYTAFGNLELGLEYDELLPGEKGDIYRDERMVLQYTLAGDSDAPAAKLTKWKFYKDKEKKNLLYELNVNGSDTQCAVKFDSNLIVKLENNKPGTLGDFYVEPVFETQNVTVDFSSVVPEEKDSVEVVKDSDTKYILREKDTKKEIGTFKLSGAKKVGDVFSIKYTPNKNYDGFYEFHYYNYRECESSNQVNGATNNWAGYDASVKYDVETTLRDTYFWLNAHVGLKAELVLNDKETTFSNSAVSIDPATVKTVKGVQPTGVITYKYYTDSSCQNEMKEKPINAGTYYVQATLAQDEQYLSTTSNVAKITIHKATPKLSALRATAITYGDAIGKSTPSGKAEGVSKETLAGKFEWIDAQKKVVPDKAGTVQAELKFVPSDKFAVNYTEAAGKVNVTVNKADPVVTLADKSVIYDGRTVEMTGAVVTGIEKNGVPEKTGQNVSYDYYSDKECKNKLSGAPTDAGTYYVLAKASSNTNYNYKKMKEPAVLTIKPRESDLIQVPMGDGKYRVYITNTAHVGPEGALQLSLFVEGEEKGRTDGLPIQEDENNRFYVEHTHKELQDVIGTADTFSVKAESYSLENDNYNINSNELTMENQDSDKVALVQKVELDYDGAAVVKDLADVPEIQGKAVTNVKWLNLSDVNEGDVAAFVGNGSKLTITPKNAGSEVVLAYVTTGAETWYVSYEVTVNPVEVTLSLEQSEVYSAQPMWADQAIVSYQNGIGETVDITEDMVITYRYFTDAACTNEIEDPLHAKIYTVNLTTPAQRNYQAGDGIGTFTIIPAELETTITDKTVVYDGKAHTLEEAVVTGFIGEDEMQGSVNYQYQKEDGTISSQAPVEAGIYAVKSTYVPVENEDYQDKTPSDTATLTIEQAEAGISYTPDSFVYNSQPAALDEDKLVVTGIEDKILSKEEYKVEPVLYYRSLLETEYTTTPPVNAGIYSVYAVKEAAGNYKEAISKPALLVIEKAEVSISIPSMEIVYTGDPVDVNATVNGLYAGDEAQMKYLFFEGENENVYMEEPPVNVGNYYVRPISLETENYKGVVGEKELIAITKATPVLSELQASDIKYGDVLEKTTFTGKATGVKGEELTGIFDFTDPVRHEIPEGGEKTVNVTFIPTGEAERNYKEAYGNVTVKVNPLTPTMVGENQTNVYNGQIIGFTSVKVEGGENLSKPEGSISCEYFANEELTHSLGMEGVKDAGRYYVNATFVSANGSYTNASEIFEITVEKAEARISMYAQVIDATEEKHSIELRGALVGVFDDPTGTVDIYKRLSNSDQEYELTEATDISVVEMNGVYGFTANLNLETGGIYDFKAVYKVGTSDNYNIHDGELEDIDTSKEPQNIIFEEDVIYKVYGDDDFEVKVLDEGNGTGKVTYRFLEGLSKEPVVSVSEDGKVHILDTGKAFCIAYKEGDNTHAPAYAIICINVAQAPVDLALKDMKVAYTGNGVSMHHPDVTSNGKAVSEKEDLPFTYEYVHKATGTVLDYLPIEAGEYTVTVSSKDCRHFLASAESATATLTIEKVKSPIELKVNRVDEVAKTILLEGSLSGVFDDPTGTITVYQKLSSAPEDDYKIVEEGITIYQKNDGTSYFLVSSDIELGEIYDFKAVYVEGPQSNYVISDDELKDVDIRQVIDEQKDEDSSNGANNDGTKTGDNTHIMMYVMLLFASIVTMILTRKRIRR